MMLARRRIEVPCSIDIEQTPESLHAHAIPEGIDIRPGDTVRVHDAPARIRFGERIAYQGRATVTRAGPLARAWTQMTALLQLTELYEVGFEARD